MVSIIIKSNGNPLKTVERIKGRTLKRNLTNNTDFMTMAVHVPFPEDTAAYFAMTSSR